MLLNIQRIVLLRHLRFPNQLFLTLQIVTLEDAVSHLVTHVKNEVIL